MLGLQTKEAIAHEQKNEEVRAGLQEALSNSKEEVKQLKEEKAAAYEEAIQLKQQLKDGQVRTSNSLKLNFALCVFSADFCQFCTGAGLHTRLPNLKATFVLIVLFTVSCDPLQPDSTAICSFTLMLPD